MLAEANCHERDMCIYFDEGSHVYTIVRNGVTEISPTSVTSFAKSYFKPFDANVVVEKNYDKWKANLRSKYYSTIHSTLDRGGTDEDAKIAIVAQWAELGRIASVEGTRMHKRAELLCNGLQPDPHDSEMKMLLTWLLEFEPDMKWQPFRTEWMIWYDEPKLSGAILVAGTLDLLLRSQETGEFALVDFKRTNPQPKGNAESANMLGPCRNTRFHCGYASSPLSQVEDSKFGQYTMQLNILAHILLTRYGVDVGERLFLLQIHETLDTAHCVQVNSYRSETRSLFSIETEKRALDTAL